ncbi:MAG: SUMF1/EgtB/PvdO family nonheme iron enzyme, partial [Verrucomicrobia bacterium]|nr:SUMF1/EgtB/PvdO family nonheme iron enzyme [Verrucomicrobiota bacterium]
MTTTKTPTRFLTLLATLALAASPAAHALLAAGNVRPAQRVGSKLVDVDYDLTGIATPVAVSLEISADGGTTWTVPATTVTGAVGLGVTPGLNLRLTWDAGTDWNHQLSSLVRFRIKVSDLWPDFALIPAGSFSMGNALAATGEGYADELPVHTVQLSAFHMAKYEVTKTLWDEVRTWGATHGYTDLPTGAGKAATHPVQTITWYAMVKWCNARSEKEGFTACYYTNSAQTVVYRTGSSNIDSTMVKWSANGYRLPTEAEWEKAARGGLSGKRFPWGDVINHTYANYYNSDASYESPKNQGYHPTYKVGIEPYTSPVGSFAANGYGVYDMAGNAWELCWDWYRELTYASSSGSDPQGAASGSDRVLRGGGYEGTADTCRASYRLLLPPAFFDPAIGFRPSRTATLASAEASNITVDTRDWVTLTLNALHGTVPGAGSYVTGSTLNLTATADPGYAFSTWTGDAEGSANPLSVLLNANKTITANFGPDTSDADGDGLSAYAEVVTYGTNPLLADTDGDGLTDGQEINTIHTNPLLDDTDGDGLLDGAEVNTHGTNPLLPDTDGDGLTDGQEINTTHTNPLLDDTDGDGLLAGAEVNTHGTNPLLPDTDGDGLT